MRLFFVFWGAFFSPLAAAHQAAFSAGSSSLGAHAHLSARVQGDANTCQKKKSSSLGVQAIYLQGDANECQKRKEKDTAALALRRICCKETRTNVKRNTEEKSKQPLLEGKNKKSQKKEIKSSNRCAKAHLPGRRRAQMSKTDKKMRGKNKQPVRLSLEGDSPKI